MTEQGHTGVGGYLLVFVALVSLFALTLAGHFMHWGLAIALLIAACKAVLVAIYFMHLRVSSRIVQCAACVGIIWLSILLTLSFSDYTTRSWERTPAEMKRAPIHISPG